MEIPSVRILVVGDSGVGKTTLLQQLCGHIMGIDNSHVSPSSSSSSSTSTRWTTGCDVFVLLYQPRNTYHASSSDVYIEFIDVGGHPKYQISRSVFYHDIHGILLVHDLSNTKSYDHVRSWLTELTTVQRTKGSLIHATVDRPDAYPSLHGVPKLVIGNKRDECSLPSTKKPNPLQDLKLDSIETSAMPLAVDYQAFYAFLDRVIAFANDGASSSSSSTMNHRTTESQSPLASLGSFFGAGLRQVASTQQTVSSRWR